MDDVESPRPDWFRGFLVPWALLAVLNAPIWIWQDGRYGIVKAVFFALAYALMQRIKRNLFDVAIFSLLMTVLHIYSRQVVNYHALVFEASAGEAGTFGLQVVLTIAVAGLFSWLFQLGSTPGAGYPVLAVAYVTFYAIEYIGHALIVQVVKAYPLGVGKLVFYFGLGVLPMVIGWALRRFGGLLQNVLEGHTAAFARLRAVENTSYVIVSCAALYAVQVVWFGFVFFAIGKLGVTEHFQMVAGCAPTPDLGAYLLQSLAASVGLDTACLGAGSLLARAVEYLEIIVTLLLALVVFQAIALARGAARAHGSTDNERS